MAGVRVFLPSPRHRTWWVEFSDHRSRHQRFSTYQRDRSAALVTGQYIDALIADRRNGETRPRPTLQKWIDAMHPNLRGRLITAGVLDSGWIASHQLLGLPLVERDLKGKLTAACLVSRWTPAIAEGERTAYHVKKSGALAAALAEACGFARFADIEPAAVSRQLKAWRSPPRNMSAATSNRYLQALRQLCRWVARSTRDTTDPLAGGLLAPLNERAAPGRRRRRALTVDDAAKLLTVTRGQPRRHGMDGPARSLAYYLALATGLRANEIRTRLVSDFELGMEGRGCVVVRAQDSKRRREDVLELPAELVEALRPFLEGLPADARPFPLPSHTAAMLADDLAAAKVDVSTAAGVADFHALRHTHGVWLFEVYKLNPRQAQDRLRVSSLALVERYTRSMSLTGSSWIDRAPALITPATAKPENSGATA